MGRSRKAGKLVTTGEESFEVQTEIVANVKQPDTQEKEHFEAPPEVAGSLRRWEEIVAEASGIEIEAMHFDQEGSQGNAAECYRRVIEKLLEAAESVAEDHPVRGLMKQRAEELANRVAYLEGLQGAQADAPLEEHIREVQLATQGVLASTLAATAGSTSPPLAHGASNTTDDVKLMGTAAALGGAAGLLLAGPLAAASMGAAAAYATTREDKAGTTARKISVAGMKVADRVVDKSLKVADLALEEGRKRLLERLDKASATACPSKLQDLLHTHKDTCVYIAAACESLQQALPMKRLTEEAKRMRARYPDRVPVICDRAPNSNLPEIARKKFVVPGQMLSGEFKYILHKQVVQANLTTDQTIYIFVDGTSPKTSKTMAELYEAHKAGDGFLHIR